MHKSHFDIIRSKNKTNPSNFASQRKTFTLSIAKKLSRNQYHEYPRKGPGQRQLLALFASRWYGQRLRSYCDEGRGCKWYVCRTSIFMLNGCSFLHGLTFIVCTICPLESNPLILYFLWLLQNYTYHQNQRFQMILRNSWRYVEDRFFFSGDGTDDDNDVLFLGHVEEQKRISY